MTAERPIGSPADEADLLQRFDIVRVMVETFEVGEYRYSSLKDAVAQARRRQDSLE